MSTAASTSEPARPLLAQPQQSEIPTTDNTVPPGIQGWLPLSATTSQFATSESNATIQNSPIPGADPKTLELLVSQDGEILLAKDAEHVYSSDGAILRGLAPETFSIIGYSVDHGILYGKDSIHAYWFTFSDWGIVQGAQPDTFTTSALILPYAVDEAHVFFAGSVVNDADPKTFSAFPNSWYAKDSKHVFSDYGYGSDVLIVAGADPHTFTPFPATYDQSGEQINFSDYGKDAYNVYCQHAMLVGADLNTFTPIDATDAKDKLQTYVDCIPFTTDAAS